MTLQPLQELKLLRRFHPFGYHFQIQAVGHGDDGADDLGVVRVAGGVADERLVDFQGVDRQALEVGQRGVASAEVVHGEAHTEFFQAAHFADSVFQVLDHDAFGDFQFQQGAGQAIGVQAVFDTFDEIVLAELARADVHAQAEFIRIHQTVVDQPFEGLAGFVEDPGADLKNQSAVFQHLDELGG
ncbi:hypothetical protein D9M69_545370 [compost metagenome]